MVKLIGVYFSHVTGSPEVGGIGLVFLFNELITDAASVSSPSSKFGFCLHACCLVVTRWLLQVQCYTRTPCRMRMKGEKGFSGHEVLPFYLGIKAVLSTQQEISLSLETNRISCAPLGHWQPRGCSSQDWFGQSTLMAPRAHKMSLCSRTYRATVSRKGRRWLWIDS